MGIFKPSQDKMYDEMATTAATGLHMISEDDLRELLRRIQGPFPYLITKLHNAIVDVQKEPTNVLAKR